MRRFSLSLVVWPVMPIVCVSQSTRLLWMTSISPSRQHSSSAPVMRSCIAGPTYLCSALPIVWPICCGGVGCSKADHPRSGFVALVRDVLRRALALRDRYLAGHVSQHGLAVARGRLVERMNRQLDHPRRVADVCSIAAHHAVEWPALFTFLFDPAMIDATNWRAEHTLRTRVRAPENRHISRSSFRWSALDVSPSAFANLMYRCPLVAIRRRFRRFQTVSYV